MSSTDIAVYMDLLGFFLPIHQLHTKFTNKREQIVFLGITGKSKFPQSHKLIYYYYCQKRCQCHYNTKLKDWLCLCVGSKDLRSHLVLVVKGEFFVYTLISI